MAINASFPSLLSNTTLGLLARASIASSRNDALESLGQTRGSDCSARLESSSCSPSNVAEFPIPQEGLSYDLRALWTQHVLDRHVQEMLFSNEPLQLSFDFGPAPP